MTATTERAEFLKAADRFAVAEDATITTRWGEDAADTKQPSILALKADADAEAARQLTDLARVRARDRVTVEGLHEDLEGRTVRIAYAGRIGISGDADLLVIRARLDRGRGLTELEGEVRL
jgi:nucleotide-binding universal stress UspA family protein